MEITAGHLLRQQVPNKDSSFLLASAGSCTAMNSASSLFMLTDFRKVLRPAFFNWTTHLIRGTQFLLGMLSLNIWAGCRAAASMGFSSFISPLGSLSGARLALAHLLSNSIFISCVVLEVSVPVIQVSGEVSMCS